MDSDEKIKTHLLSVWLEETKLFTKSKECMFFVTDKGLYFATSTAGCAVSGGVNLTCSIGLLAKDPTPGQRESGDEPSFTVTVKAQIPETYLKPAGNAAGPGALGSRFEIDGNLVADLGTATRDWGNVGAGLINKLDPPLVDLSPRYAADDSFVDGAKEDDPVPSVLDHEVPPNKSDLSNFLIAQDTFEGHAFLALGWLRTNSLGTANFDFELNQRAAISGNGATPVRTDGDVLFSFDFESSGNNVVVTMREWDADTQLWGSPPFPSA